MTRRDFLGRSTQIALGLGAIQLGVGHAALSRGLGAPSLRRAPLPARTAILADELTLGNDAITAVWTTTGGSFRPARFSDGLNKMLLPAPAQAFTFTFADKSTLHASDMRMMAPPHAEMLAADTRASRGAERLAGRQVTITLQDSSGRIEAVWRGILRDGSRYIRQEITVRAIGAEVPLREVTLLDVHVPNAMVPGTVRGTPIVIGNSYVAFEHPLADNSVDGDRVRCWMSRTLPLRPGTTLECSAVIGVAHPGQ
ncbi:MAG TPA: hypothetical protein VIC55_09185, partial [Gemmatimonadaceae bacterium]